MKFRCSAGELSDALSIVTRALPQKSTNPVYENLFIESSEGEIRLTCSDERFTISTTMPAVMEEHGSMLVPGKLFNDVIRFLPEGEAEISTNKNHMTRVTLGGSRTNISGIDPIGYPRLPEMDEGSNVTVPQSLLREMIEKTDFAVDPQNMREILTGEYMEIDRGSLTLVALDGFRMAVISSPVSPDIPHTSAIIPAKAIGDLAKLLSNSDEDMAQMSFTRDKLAIVIGNTVLYTSLINGEYINYRQIVPKSFATRVTMDTEEMRRCVERAALIAREGKNNLVRLEINEDTMVMESHSDVADTRQELPIELEGAGIQVNFNVRYLSDVLKNSQSGKIVMSLNTPVTPCVMQQEADQEYYHLILPVRA